MVPLHKVSWGFGGFCLVGFVGWFSLRKQINQSNQALNTHISSPPQVIFLQILCFWFCFVKTMQICEVVKIYFFLPGVPKKPLLENYYSVIC